jgi:hypothetical protein
LGRAGEAPAEVELQQQVEERNWRHDVSHLIVAGFGEGWCLGWHPRSKRSMMIMGSPQQGH